MHALIAHRGRGGGGVVGGSGLNFLINRLIVLIHEFRGPTTAAAGQNRENFSESQRLVLLADFAQHVRAEERWQR